MVTLKIEEIGGNQGFYWISGGHPGRWDSLIFKNLGESLQVYRPGQRLVDHPQNNTQHCRFLSSEMRKFGNQNRENLEPCESFKIKVCVIIVEIEATVSRKEYRSMPLALVILFYFQNIYNLTCLL